jgi:hypothetical protein
LSPGGSTHLHTNNTQNNTNNSFGDLNNLRERYHLGDLGVDVKIILGGSSEVGRGCMDWIELTQDRGRCRALVSAVINLRVP